MKKLCDILKNAREDKDLTQIEVMKSTGINNKTLSGYENGIAEPDIYTLVKLFDFYQLSIDKTFDINQQYSGQKEILSNSEQILINEFRKLDIRKRQEVLVIIQALNNMS